MMHSTVQHTLSFGQDYNIAPCRNILCSIVVCIRNIPAIFTSKFFRYPLTNVQTSKTGLRSICRWNYSKFNSIEQRFVSQKLTKLIETPTVQFCLFYFAFCYYLFTYCMVRNGNKSSFSPTKPFQKFLTSFSAFGLNRSPYFRIFFTNLFKLFRIKISAIRQSANICLSKITPDKTFNIFYFFFWNFNSLENVKFTFLKYQIRFAFYVRNVFLIMADKRNFQTTSNSPQRNNLFVVSQNSTVISNCPKRTKFSFNFLVKFVGIRYFRNATDNHLSRKIKTIFYSAICFVMEFVLIVKFLCKSNFRNFITSSIRLYQSVFERSKLLLCWQQLYLESKFHDAKIIHIFETTKLFTKNLKQEERQFLLYPKGIEVSLA